MALNLASPGIVVREVDLTVGRVGPTSNKIGAIVAPFAKGPVDSPTLVETEQDLLNNFGEPYATDNKIKDDIKIPLLENKNYYKLWNEFYNTSNKEFTKFIKELLPKNYNEINSHKERKTTIVDIDKYNEFCNNNEKLYIKTLIDDIFI